jgi:DNA-binding CsgD family transcriptional regulator
MRPARAPARRLDDLSAALCAPGGISLEELATELRAALDAERAAVFGFQGEDDGVRLAFFHASGMPRATAAALDEGLALDPCWAYHPLRPTAADRNRVVTFPSRSIEPLREQIPALDHVLSSQPWIRDDHQIRFLVCDGPDLLAWFGGFRGGRAEFGDREGSILRRLAPALRDRLRLERDLGRGRLASAALPATLEEIPAPAYLLSARGDVVHANAAGTARLAGGDEGRETRAALATRAHPAFRWTELRGPGMPPHLLAVARRPPSRVEDRAAACAREWALTKRQAEVLALLARGLSNKVLAAELGCGEPTVEFHVTALLAKAGCESRAALVARFWSEG